MIKKRINKRICRMVNYSRSKEQAEKIALDKEKTHKDVHLIEAGARWEIWVSRREKEVKE